MQLFSVLLFICMTMHKQHQTARTLIATVAAVSIQPHTIASSAVRSTILMLYIYALLIIIFTKLYATVLNTRSIFARRSIHGVQQALACIVLTADNQCAWAVYIVVYYLLTWFYFILNRKLLH